MMFDTAGATPSDDLVRDFVTQVQQYQSPIAETIEVQVEQPLESAAPTQARRMRMNTKFRTQTTYVSLSLSLIPPSIWYVFSLYLVFLKLLKLKKYLTHFGRGTLNPVMLFHGSDSNKHSSLTMIPN